MPKKKKGSSTKILIAVILIAVVSVAYIAWHDGMIGVTPMGSINDFSIDNGTSVTVKGEVISIIGTWVLIADDTGGLGFNWPNADSLTSHTIIVVRGEVSTFLTLTDVCCVAQVWLFA